MVSSKHGRKSKCNFKFDYQGQEVEKVKEYVYLGVLFRNTGNFKSAADRALQKAFVALGPLKELLIRSKCKNWTRRTHLFESLAMSCLMYGSETWGFNHTDTMETLQQKFYKNTFGVSWATPH